MINNIPPQIVLGPTSSELSGILNFNFEVIDPENDQSNFSFFYLNNGIWNMIESELLWGLLANLRLKWNSRLSLDGTDEMIRFAVLPFG